MTDYKYDLAISFLKDDEGLASRLAEKLSEKYTVFLYSERQRELAGTDGEVKFRKVFSIESRYVLVIYRPGWGETQWTRVEAEAIRERTASQGYDFFKLILIDSNGKVPAWVPKHQLWIGYQRFGFDEVVVILDARLQELGAEPQIENPQTIAARIKKSQEYRRIRDDLRRNQVSVDAMYSLFEKSGLLLQVASMTVQEVNPSLSIIVKTERNKISVDSYRYNATLFLIESTSNGLDDGSGLKLIFGERPESWERKSDGGGLKRLKEATFKFDYFQDEKWYWVSERDKTKFTEESLSDHIIKELLLMIEKRPN